MKTVLSVDELIIRVSQWSPGFADRIQGASASEIQELTELVGRPLEPEHEQFLARMGHDRGGLVSCFGGSWDISDIIEDYQDRKKETEEGFLVTEIPSDRALLETPDPADVGEMFIYLMSRPGQRAQVVTGSLEAESLTGCLGRNAFEAFRLRALPCHVFYTSSYRDVGMRPVLEDARRILLGLGFEEQWFSDSVFFAGEAEGVAVLLCQYERQGLTVSLSSQSLRQAEAVGEALSKKIKLTRV